MLVLAQQKSIRMEDNMKQDKRFIISVVWVVLGIVLISLSVAGKVDMFWNGAGSGLLAVGVVQLLRFYRLNKNETYREMVEIEEKDERNRFIRNKAWAWTGYLFLMFAALACIILKIAGQDLLSMAASGAVCLMLVLYWIAYVVLRRKY